MRHGIAIALVVGAIAAVLSAGAATAAPPQRTTFTIDDTFTVDGICAFPIVEHAQGKAAIVEFVDRNGNVTRELDTTPGLKLSFSANGITLATASPSHGHWTFNADGTATLAVTGLSGHISVPGQGTIALSAGRIVAVFSDDEEPQLIAMNGTFSFGFGDLPPIEEQLCDALTPA
jgi:hypothetical protein